MKKIILTLTIIVSILLVTGCDSGATTSDNTNSISKTREQQTYHMNDNIYITKADGTEYRIKITGIKETNDRNEYSDTRADRVVIIDYEYENISMEDDLYISSMDFKAYDKDNNSMQTYEVIDYKYSDTISTGRKATAQMVFALNNTNNYIELEFYDNMWNSKSNCKIILEW